jgi:stringent starvation protein B
VRLGNKLSMTSTKKMNSNRPYLIRAMYEWISDNHLTPYLLIDANQRNVQVPNNAVKDGQVVLNIAARAVAALDLGNECVRFSARFSGVSFAVEIPVGAVLAIYAQENGQGMMFPNESGNADPTPPPTDSSSVSKTTPHLRVVK